LFKRRGGDGTMQNIFRKMSIVITVLIFLQSIISYSAASASILKETVNISQGVTLTEERKENSGRNYAFHTLNINLSSPYTSIELGLPNPLTKLTTTSTLARMHTYEQHRVVGAINGSFFHMDSGKPAYLLVKDDRIINLGAVSYDSNDYMHTPAAFGITKDGKAIADKFQLTMTLSHHGKSYQIDSFNRSRDSNESILYTSSYRYPKTRTNPYGLEVVVTNVTRRIDGEAKLGETIKGKVTSIRPYGQSTSATIPKNGFVISAHGETVDMIRDLAIGDEVELTINIDNRWRGSKFIMASGPLLVQRGKVQMTIDENSPRAYERYPRSAVAVDATGTRVFFVTVDGRQSGYSNGMTLKEFAEYIVRLGGYQAINLDGGGSTTLVARKHGDTFSTVVNSPSDGRERAVSSVLEVISTAPLGEPTYMSVVPTQSGKLAVGGRVTYQPKYILDQYYNPLNVSNAKLALEVVGGIGRVEGNAFIAEKAGQGSIIVKYGKAKQTIPVTVVSTPHQLVAEPQSIVVGRGKSQKITIKALDESGKSLIYGEQAISWTISGNVGTITKDGTFTANGSEGTGTIKATFGTKSITIPVTVTEKPIVLDSLDSLKNWTTESIRANSSASVVAKDEAHQGSGAIKLTYNFSQNKKGTAASYLVAKKPIHIVGKPEYIGLWVYGDAKKHWLRGKLRDGKGQEITINFTEEGKLDWNGWRYVQAKVPDNIVLPIRIEKIYVTEPVVAKQGKGEVYFDKLQAVYSPNYKEKYFEATDNPKKVDKKKTWTITFNVALDRKSVNSETIYIEDQFGARQAVKIELQQNEKVIKVYAPSSDYKEGEMYRLVISKGVYSKTGRALARDHKTIFLVQ